MGPRAFTFATKMEVRDYECDLQGVVNNAVYLNYLEHARHLYLKSLGIDFAALHDQGYDLVLTRAEVDFKASLKSGDRFTVKLGLGRQGRLRFVFWQEIERCADHKVVAVAKMVGTGLHRGRPSFPPQVEKVLAAAAELTP